MISQKVEKRAALALIAASLLTSCSPAPSGSAPIPTQFGQRYVALDDIDRNTVGQLGLAFEFRDFVVRGRTQRGVEATPIMRDGVLYFSGPWGVAYAVDARTGQSLWVYDPQSSGYAARNACCDAVNRGVAIAGQRLFVAATDGQLAAVDIETGTELWKVDTIVDPRWNTSSTDAPLVAGDLVIIGNSGADMGSRGYVSAYHVDDGSLAWRFWVVPGDPANGPDENPDVTTARETWPEDTRWELGLGGNTWAGLAYDPTTDTVFVGTGNGGPHASWLRSNSGAETDQLYLSSIVALSKADGRVKWHYQTTPGDSWDYNASSPFVMADLQIDGQDRKVIMQAPKNGFFYVLDRMDGELLQAQPFANVTWASHIDMTTGRPVLTKQADYRDEPKVIAPGVAGAHSWTPLSFSPRTGLVYVPVSEGAMSFQADPTGTFLRGAISQSVNNGVPPFADPELQAQFEQGPSQYFGGLLKAIDPETGKVVWTSEERPFLTTGTLVVGDLVFQGGADGYFNAYDAADGTRLLHLNTGTGILGAPISYELDGVQYIAFLAGFGGPQGAHYPPYVPAQEYENFGRLIVLKLGGGEVPLPPRKTAPAPQPLPDPIAASPATLARGERLYQQYCHRCHWTGGSASNYPNLWNIAPGTLHAFEAIVGEGAMEFAGMAGFSDALSREDRDAIKAFLVNDIILKRQQGKSAGAQSSRVTQ